METYCIFSAFYLPHLGGVENYTAHLSHALAARGHRVIVVTSRRKDQAVFENVDGVRVVRLSSAFLLGDRFPLLRKNEVFREAWESLKSMSIDHVVVNTRFYPLSILGLDFARSKGVIPLVVEHGSSPLTAGHHAVDVFVRRYEEMMTARGRKRSPRYFAVSERSAAWLGNFGIEAEGILHNAIDADRFASMASDRDFRSELSLAPDSFLVAFTGRLLVDKGIIRICDAIDALVAEGRSEMHAVFAGDGPDRALLERRAGSHIHVLGRMDAPDVSALLACSQVFCLPTTYPEGFPTSLLEAAAQGKAVIVTDTGGARELIPDGRFGIVLREASSAEVAEGIVRFREDESYLRTAGEMVRDRVANLFSWDKTADDLIAAFS